MTERSLQSFRSRRPGVTATVAVIIGGLVAVLAALLLWGAAGDGALDAGQRFGHRAGQDAYRRAGGDL